MRYRIDGVLHVFQKAPKAMTQGEPAYWNIIMNGDAKEPSLFGLNEVHGTMHDHIVNAEKPIITAQCFRVPVSDGHTAAVFVSFDKKPTKEQMLEAWANFRGPAQELNLPSAPKQFLHYFTEPDRPQPKLDRNTENGMAVCIGRLREDTLFDYKFACMSHNTLRGAAGGAVLLAELLAAKGYFD